MQKIGIDVDNVIADSAKALAIEINKYYKTNLKYSDIRMYDFHTVLGISANEMRPFWNKVFSKKIPQSFKLVKGAKKALLELKQKFEIFIITSRFKEYEKCTVQWLKREGIPYDHIVHSEEKEKHIYAKKHGIKLFIEDDLEQAIYMAEEGIKVLLFDHPWNRNVDVKHRFSRVKGWGDLGVEVL